MTPKILIQLGKTGDLVNLLPIAYHASQQGERLSIMVSKQYAGVLSGCSYVDCIEFDGEPWELERAVTEAKKLTDAANIRVAQVLGPPEVVKAVAFAPIGRDHAIEESFQKESWSVIGKMRLWKDQPPLVFDRRNRKREEALLEAMPENRNRKKIILISTSGETSPFKYSDLLFELLTLKFGRKFLIVDLALFHGEQFYDLLGVYEKAYCLVATDSAPLHLAYACPDLPVVALVNDSPSLWHGSAWRPNHICHIRYRDFPARAVEMLECIDGCRDVYQQFYPGRQDGLKRVGHAGGGQHLESNPAYIPVWSEYETRRDPESFAGLTYSETCRVVWTPVGLGAFGRDSKYSMMKDEKRIPFVKDVIRLAMLRANDQDRIVLLRPETRLSKLPDCELGYAHRTIKDGDGLTYHPAIDLFVFTKKWWREHQSEYPDMLLGSDPYWWRVMLGLFRKHGAKELNWACHRPPMQPAPATIDKPHPRLLHNEALAKDWFVKTGLKINVPPVHEQVECVTVNRRALHPFGYNPCLTRHKGELLMAYRWHDQGDPSTELALAKLDSKFNVLSNQWLEAVGCSGSIEDPRFFHYRGELHAAIVVSTWPARPAKSVVRHGPVYEDKNWQVRPDAAIAAGKNDGAGMEKNWVFFEHEGGLFLIYQSSPEQHVLLIRGETVGLFYKSKAPRWPWGSIKGGTSPMPYEGKLLRFFHSTLDNEPVPWRRRYYIGACLMEPKPPFSVIRISSEPIIRGSEEDELTPTERSACAHRKPQVVFPTGCVEDNGSWLLSFGINDCCCGIARIKPENLKL